MSNRKHWIIGEPGGPAGPFYSVVKPGGKIVAMQILDKETAEMIANIPLLQGLVDDLKGRIKEMEAVVNPEFTPVLQACEKLYQDFYSVRGNWNEALEKLLDAWDTMLG